MHPDSTPNQHERAGFGRTDSSRSPGERNTVSRWLVSLTVCVARPGPRIDYQANPIRTARICGATRSGATGTGVFAAVQSIRHGLTHYYPAGNPFTLSLPVATRSTHSVHRR